MDGVSYDWLNGDRFLWLGIDVATAEVYPIRVFSPKEQRSIELKALEQALREAGMAKADLEPLLPTGYTWPFLLTDTDRDFLRVNKISPA